MFNSFNFGADGGPSQSSSSGSGGLFDEKGSRVRHYPASHSSDDEKFDMDVKEGPSTTVKESYDDSQPTEKLEGASSPRRTFATVMSDFFRRSSETSNDPPSRKHSQNNISSGRGIANTLGLFQSHNPDVDSEEAAAVNHGFPRKSSIQSHHSGGAADDVVPMPSPEMTRRGSYMPKNASASFLKTATGTSEEKPPQPDEKTAPRKPSIMGVVAGGDPSAHVNGRRPSGMTPNNVASRYVRSAAQTNNTDDENDPARRRRSSGRPRQGSGNSNGDASIKPVGMQPDQYMYWQQSVQRNGSTSVANNRVSFASGTNRKGSTIPEDPAKGQSGHGDMRYVNQSDGNGNNNNTSGVIISVQPSTPERAAPQMKQNRPINQYLPNQQSQHGTIMANSGPDSERELSQIEEIESRPETPLESLGFKGAVPA